MELSAPPGVIETPQQSRDRWLTIAACALYEARRAAFPEAYPLPWDQAPRAVSQDFRYLAMSAYRRSLPFVSQVLVEMVAMHYATLEGWIYPDCDNKIAPDVDQRDRAAFAAQRRQNFRHKARQIISAIWQYLEHDTDTEAQRKQTVDRASGQVTADAMVVSNWRSTQGLPSEVNRG